MKNLSLRNEELLLRGAKMCGSFVDGYDYIVENLYVAEAKELFKFCEFIDNEVGGAGRANIKYLFQCFKNPEVIVNKKYVAVIKAKIEEIRKY